MLDTLFTHSVARREGKPPFFFSRFNFERMKERGNTHYCFYCGGNCGFTPSSDGSPFNHTEGSHNPMKEHDSVLHAAYVVGGADKYNDPWQWLASCVGSDFPYIVAIPSIN